LRARFAGAPSSISKSIGGNWQVERAVFGIQADAHWADIEGHGSCFDAGAVATAGISFACNDKVSSFGTVTGRVGAAVDRALIYGELGLGLEPFARRPFRRTSRSDQFASLQPLPLVTLSL